MKMFSNTLSLENQRKEATQLLKSTSSMIKAEPGCIDAVRITDSSIRDKHGTKWARNRATTEVGLSWPHSEGVEQRRAARGRTPGKKSRVRMPPVTIIEQEYLLGIIEGYLPITEKRKYDSMTSENKDAAWREISKHFCSVSGFSRRDEHQLRKWWKNMKVRAKKLYLCERERGGWAGFEDLEKMDLDSMMKKVCTLIPDQMLAGPGRTGLPGDVDDDDDHVGGDIDDEYDKEDDQYSDDVMQDEEPGQHPQLSTEASHFPPEESNPTTNFLPSSTAPFHHPSFYQAPPPQTVPPPPPPPVPPPAPQPPNEDVVLMMRKEHDLAIMLLRTQIENAKREHALKVSLLERKIELVATQQKQLERQLMDSDPISQMTRLSSSRSLYNNL